MPGSHARDNEGEWPRSRTPPRPLSLACWQRQSLAQSSHKTEHFQHLRVQSEVSIMSGWSVFSPSRGTHPWGRWPYDCPSHVFLDGTLFGRHCHPLHGQEINPPTASCVGKMHAQPPPTPNSPPRPNDYTKFQFMAHMLQPTSTLPPRCCLGRRRTCPISQAIVVLPSIYRHSPDKLASLPPSRPLHKAITALEPPPPPDMLMAR